MTMRLLGILASAVLCSWCVAQQVPSQTGSSEPKSQQTPASPPAQSRESAAVPKIASGSVIPVQLTKTVDVKKAKPGDEVDASVTQDLKTASGEVLIPKDTKVVGHITEATPRSKEQKQSQVGIAFDHAVMKDGNTETLPMSIQAVIAPHRENTGDASGRQSVGLTAPASSAGMPGGNGGGRPGAMGSEGTPLPQASGSYPGGGEQPTSHDSEARSPITAKTQGVVGIEHYSLSTAGDATRGSVIASEKGNVKLERGTLLRVHQ